MQLKQFYDIATKVGSRKKRPLLLVIYLIAYQMAKMKHYFGRENKADKKSFPSDLQ